MRHVFVTGGTSGIGRAIAEAFAAEGCAVMATAKTREEIASAPAFPQGIHAHPLDIAKLEHVRGFMAAFKRLDVLVNAAGMILREGKEFDPENFEQVVDVNLNGTMRVCSAARELLIASRGCIINIASMLSFFGSGA